MLQKIVELFSSSGNSIRVTGTRAATRRFCAVDLRNSTRDLTEKTVRGEDRRVDLGGKVVLGHL